MGLVFVHEDREYCLEPGETLETDLGVLEVPDDVRSGDVIETHLGTEFTARALRVPDMFHHFERTGAPMLPRDIGLILGETGAGDGDRVLDAGTGTGVLAAALARTGAEVVTCERNDGFAEVARDNIALGGVADRVDVVNTDVLDVVEDFGNFDILTLDTQDADAVIAHAPDLLVSGGFLAVYSPFVEQARLVNEAAWDGGLADIRTIETIQREMDFDERGSRPTTAPVGHTGFLTIARRE